MSTLRLTAGVGVGFSGACGLSHHLRVLDLLPDCVALRSFQYKPIVSLVSPRGIFNTNQRFSLYHVHQSDPRPLSHQLWRVQDLILRGHE